MKRFLLATVAAAGIAMLFAACSDKTSLGPTKIAPGAAPGGPVFGLTTPANGGGACMGFDAAGAKALDAQWVDGNNSTPYSFNCTANDISIASARITQYSTTGLPGSFVPLSAGSRISCEPNQTVFVETVAALKANATQRWDIGIWIADPVENDAASGASCKHYNLIPSGAAGTVLNQDGDHCGDMGTNNGLPGDSLIVPLDTLQVVCPAGQPTVTVHNCIGWQNSDLTSSRGTCETQSINGTTVGGALGFRYGTLPENASKCNCTPFSLPIDVVGTITINKHTTGGDDTFSFSSDVGGNSDPVVTSPFSILTSGGTGSQVIHKVKAGTYHIAELLPPSSFDFDHLSCTPNNTFASATIDGTTRTATITMGSGGDITCDFYNVKKASLTIEKTVVGAGATFSYTGTGADVPATFSRTPAANSTTTDAAFAIGGANLGTKYVQETAVAGYTLTGISCTANGATVVIGRGGSGAFSNGGTDGFDPGDNTVKVTVAAGNTPSCTFTNTQDASLAIQKTVVGASATFNYTGTGAGVPASFSRTPAANSTTSAAAFAISGADLGIKYVEETVPAGYNLTNISCTANGATVVIGSGGSGAFSNGGTDGFDPGDNTVKVTVAAGNTPTCTFTNTQGASLAIQKTVVGASATFSYTGTGADILTSFSRTPAANSTTSAAAFSISGANLGDKYVQETVLAGYTLTGISCTANGATVVIGTGGSGSFSNGGSNGYDAGDNTVKVTVGAGNTPTCTFTNTQDGSLAIQKTVVGAGTTFSYTGTGSDVPASFTRTPANNGTTSAAAFAVTGDHVGDKYVQETVPSGYALTGIACTANGATVVIGRGGSASFTNGGSSGFDVGDNTVKVTLGAGNTPTCTFTNTQLATVTINKRENSALPLAHTWSFDIRTGASTLSAGTVEATGTANLTSGVVTFTCSPEDANCTNVGGVANLLPGTYQLCETGMPAGYHNNFTGFTPAGATAEGVDNSSECVAITLSAGGSGVPTGVSTVVPDPIDNVAPPGGDARTIGYWRNWSSCTGGQQFAKATAPGGVGIQFTLDGYLPASPAVFPLGDITSLSCNQAVLILSKSDIVTGTKMASDAAYGLAAQLLAAKLNVAAGAGTCSAALTAIANGQALLANNPVNFLGTGNYLGKVNGPTLTAIKNNALLYASQLDAYNNNTLCP